MRFAIPDRLAAEYQDGRNEREERPINFRRALPSRIEP